MAEQSIVLNTPKEIAGLFGNFDANILTIEREFSVNISNRGEDLRIIGEPENVEKATKAVKGLLQLIERGEQLTEQSVHYILSLINEGQESRMNELGQDCICISTRGRPVKPKTLGQKSYVKAIGENTIVLGIGPAGTGKTYLAVAMAVAAYKAKDVSRIILTRPAVEAGEKLGFLPGDLQNKVDPYLRPLYDAMFDLLGAENYQRMVERQQVEVAPLAYMRGRTLDDAFIILDEAQNTTPEQMKMFLTRLGFNSKAVITGDITQIDLPGGKRSGLVDAMHVLKNVEDISIQMLNERDVVRHHLVQKIIKAYEKYEKKAGTQNYHE
ncbi:MAG TPA: phosphate starvation-inducible protein PhoH [Ruminococcaceae bacterium]|nr:phosphate starvation-inducible protein PhoH [Oscillospiraceae bacterium]